MSGPAETATPVLILAGGKGTRLRALDSTRPKPMVPVCGKPFLEWLVGHYVGLGYREFILSTGYLAELIETHGWAETFPGAAFVFERETTPLGAGGAVKAIFERRGLERAWVINGDTLLPEPLPALPSFSTVDALYTVLERSKLFDATPNLEVRGNLVVAESPNGHYFDGGAVLVTRAAVQRFSGPLPCSIHGLLGPSMAAHRVGWSLAKGTCYDIGTPERYHRFERYLVETKQC